MPVSKFRFLPVLAGIAAVGWVAFGGPAAHADVFSITSDDCTNTCFGGASSGGTITVTQDGSNMVKVDVELDSTVLAGFADSVGKGNLVLFDLPSFTSVTLTGDTPSFAATSVSAGSLQFDGFGTFNYSLVCSLVSTTCNGSNVDIGTSLIFDVGATGITPTSFEQSTGSKGGQFFAVDVVGQNGNTGLVDASVRTVPAPVIGHGLLVLLAIGGVLSGGKLLENLKKRQLHTA